eukprot:3935051-Rhodomonas_salina.1
MHVCSSDRMCLVPAYPISVQRPVPGPVPGPACIPKLSTARAITRYRHTPASVPGAAYNRTRTTVLGAC